jgi:hypothetical protein
MQQCPFTSKAAPQYFFCRPTRPIGQLLSCQPARRQSRSRALRDPYRNMEMPMIEAIHYFLIRDLSVEMTQAHMTFRKMGRLEPRLCYLGDQIAQV